MKKKKEVIRDAFTEADLPHTRPQVFLTVYKTRAFFIFKISLLLLLFCSPLLLWDIFMRLSLDNNLATSTLSDYDLMKETFNLTLIKNGIGIILFGIAGIGFGGAVHAFQALVWNQLVVASDFFSGMKKNIFKYILWGILAGISFFLFEFAIRGVPLTDLEIFGRIIVYGLSSVQLALISIFIAYLYLQNEYYFVNGFNLLTNGIKFTIVSFIPMIGFMLIIIAPYFLVFLHSFIINFVAIFLFMFLVSTGLISIILHADYQFDKRINKDNYPEIYDRGVYRQNEN